MRRKSLTVLTIAGAVGGTLLSASATAQTVHARLVGYNEVPSVSTVAKGRFKAKINEAAGIIFWELEYEGLQGAVTQAHIHLGQRHTTGGITVWLCETLGTPAPPAVAAATPECTPGSGNLNGTIVANQVLASGIASQQFPAGAFGQLIRAMRAGATYVNVHTSLSPPGEIRGQIRHGDDRDDHGSRD